jgi:NADH pyrophosphatase NudC (nudix superfamily)
VTTLRCFASQTRPYPHSPMIGFAADYAGGDIVTDPAGIVEARWFTRAQAREVFRPAVSISGRLLASFLDSGAAA